MRFTAEELARIADWEPIAPGFGRNDATVNVYIQPILDRIRSNQDLACRVVQDGGMANYFAFIVHEAALCKLSGGPCVAVYLSLMAPVGVFGRTTFLEGVDFFGLNWLNPEEVSEWKRCTTRLERLVAEAVRDASCYELLGRQVIDGSLPEGVDVYEYCFCDEPWDRVFHALFANAD